MRPGQIRVFDGLRLTTEHLTHLQDALRSGVEDIREILGLGVVYRGFEVAAASETAITVQPGLAFDFQKNRLVADEPRPIGDDAGPTPYDLVLAGLGACTSMTVRMYADRKGWPLEQVRVTLRHSRIHAEDCAACETTKGWIDHIDVDVELVGDLDDTQRQRLMQIAERCPVHQTLTSEVDFASTLR